MQDPELVDSLNSLAGRLPAPVVTFAECLARLRERREGEGEEFRLTECQRRQAEDILAALARGASGKEIAGAAPVTANLSALAERVRDLRARKKALDEELVGATEELVAAVGVGATVAGSAWRVRIGEPRLSVKIPEVQALPPEFLTLQPDRKAILTHIKEVAEVPAGVEISETRATVYFSKP
jgi:hypothetical protein